VCPILLLLKGREGIHIAGKMEEEERGLMENLFIQLSSRYSSEYL
jgi:hypothetical protein